MRKYFALIIIFATVSQSVNAASSSFNKEINYQGKLTDSSGVLVGDGDYNMFFRIYTASSGGNAIWSESRTSTSTAVTVTNGLFSVLLGDITSLSSLNFNQDLYLGVSIGATSSTPTWDAEMSPRKQFGTVPSAFVADTLDGLDSDAFIRSDIVGTSTGGLLVTASSSLQTTTFVNATSTSATSTSFFSITASSSAFYGGTLRVTSATTSGYLAITGSATSTGVNGWNITGGCFSISGVCVDDSHLTGAGSAGLPTVWTSAIALSSSSTLSRLVGGTGTSTFVTGGVIFADGSKLTQDSGNFFWDNAISRLGIGTSSPYAALSVVGSTGVVADHYVATGTTESDFQSLTGTFATTTALFTTSASSTAFYGGSLFVNNASSTGILNVTRGLIVGGGGGIPISTAKLYVQSGDLVLDNAQAYQAKDSNGVVRNLVSYTSSNNVQFANAASTGGLQFFNTNDQEVGIKFYTGTPDIERMHITATGTIIFNPLASSSDFIVQGLGDSSLFRIDGTNKKIGISTTSPSAKVDISGGMLRVLTSDTFPSFGGNGVELGYYTTGDFGFVLAGNRDTGAPTYKKMGLFGSSLGFFVGATEKVSVSSAGYLGVGTTSPYAPLSVAGSGGVVAESYTATTTTATSTFLGPVMVGGGQPATLNEFLAVGSSSIKFLVSKNNGYVGIASSTPTGNLSVTGSVFLQGLTTSAGAQSAVCWDQISGEMLLNTGITTCDPSSIRYKHDINDIDVGLSEVLSLRPRIFQFKQGAQDVHLGFKIGR